MAHSVEVALSMKPTALREIEYEVDPRNLVGVAMRINLSVCLKVRESK